MLRYCELFYQTKLARIDIRQLLRQLGREAAFDNDNTSFGGGEALTIWVYQLLTQLPSLSDSQHWFLVDALKAYLLEAGATIGEELQKKSPKVSQYQLFFADGRYVMWTGNRGVLDIEEGTTLDMMPFPAVESTAYNLTEMFRRNRQRCLQLRAAAEGQNAEPAARNAEG